MTKSNDGHKPVAEFIDSLETKMQIKIFRQLKLLKEFGPRLGEPFSKHLVNGIFELRIQQSNNITTQNTPQKEIVRASQYKSEFEGRRK